MAEGDLLQSVMRLRIGFGGEEKKVKSAISPTASLAESQ